MRVKLIDAYVYHYGWVKNPYFIKEKEKYNHRYWHTDEWIQTQIKDDILIDMNSIDSLSIFEDTHPKVMLERIQKRDWDFEFDVSKKNFNFRKRLLYLIESKLGIRLFEYKNFKQI